MAPQLRQHREMKISKNDLLEASKKNLLQAEQVDPLWQYFQEHKVDHPSFHLTHVIYYFGGVLLLASMSWFLTSAGNDGLALMLISLGFGAVYVFAGRYLWHKLNLKIPGGLVITAAVGLTPIAVYGFQKLTGLWPQGNPGNYQNYHYWVKGSWFFMEVGTIAAALLALRFFKFPFLTFPMAFSLWYISMDVTPLIFGKTDFTWDERKLVSVIFGVVMIAATYLADLRRKGQDFLFWLYLYGALSFWGGLTMMNSNSELGKFLYCMINLALIGLSVYLRRKIFVVLGGIGVFLYIGHLAQKFFQNSYLFPIALSLIGLAIIVVGIKYQKHQKAIEKFIENLFPSFLQKWRPKEHR